MRNVSGGILIAENPEKSYEKSNSNVPQAKEQFGQSFSHLVIHSFKNKGGYDDNTIQKRNGSHPNELGNVVDSIFKYNPAPVFRWQFMGE